MFDLVTLSGLYFFTAVVSLIWYLIGRWKGGIYWFWMWTGVALWVAAVWEVFAYIHWPLWVLAIVFCIPWIVLSFFLKKVDHKVTLTRMITKSGTGEPLALRTKTEGRLIATSYLIGGTFLVVHVWVW